MERNLSSPQKFFLSSCSLGTAGQAEVQAVHLSCNMITYFLVAAVRHSFELCSTEGSELTFTFSFSKSPRLAGGSRLSTPPRG